MLLILYVYLDFPMFEKILSESGLMVILGHLMLT